MRVLTFFHMRGLFLPSTPRQPKTSQSDWVLIPSSGWNLIPSNGISLTDIAFCNSSQLVWLALAYDMRHRPVALSRVPPLRSLSRLLLLEVACPRRCTTPMVAICVTSIRGDRSFNPTPPACLSVRLWGASRASSGLPKMAI
jgi:hypothetical protein